MMAGMESRKEKRAAMCLKVAERLSLWFVKCYGPYLAPEAGNTENIDNFLQLIREREPTDAVRRSARRAAANRAASMNLGEDETRVIIDHQLRAEGWQADTWALRYSLGTRPEKRVVLKCRSNPNLYSFDFSSLKTQN